ncbi:MAG: WecB/TagA/CpsF family glycosyltransferase [Parafilimonas terrae]|nr:WecB/TagA/CpsF family glycosyltransferase [Parafilimonas terrae]
MVTLAQGTNLQPAVESPGARPVFLDLPFDRFSLEQTLSALLAVPPGERFRYLVTPNVDHMLRITQRPEIAQLYREAWLCINDSRVLNLLARSHGIDLPAVPGSDLVAALLTHPDFDKTMPVLIVGGNEGLVAQVCTRTGLKRVKQIRPPMGLSRNPAALAATVEAIEAEAARFVILAVGSPQQEMLANALARRGRTHGVGLCIGAGLDFLVGERLRAPGLMRAAHLEWLFRLACEPTRLAKRYLVDGPKIFRIVWDRRPARWERAS